MEESRQIAQALKRVHSVVKKNKAPVIHTSQITREDREFLVKNHWLQEIIKGWYLLVRPDILSGDSTVWYANFWDFLRLYLEHHYGKKYCLSAENSLELLLGCSITPQQVVVIAKESGGFSQSLPFNTSVLVYQDPDNFAPEITKVRGIQVMTLPYAVCRVTPTFFQKNPYEAEVALQSIREPVELIEMITKYKFKRPAARLVKAYQFLGNTVMAHALEKVLQDLGVRLKEDNPFDFPPHIVTSSRITSPYYARVLTLWNSMRDDVIRHFPLPSATLQQSEVSLEELYVQDAYNSLSIEGYVVDETLIERVRQGSWDPVARPEDAHERNALAARGYYEAHQEVKKTLSEIWQGKNQGDAFADDLMKWHYALFTPSVRAGILEKKELFGYRKWPVYIKNSRHVPPPKEALLDAMDALFTCLRKEPHAAVQSIVGHYIFVYIHPYLDGNGRLARLLMNVQFVSGGYPWAIITIQNRERYMRALALCDLEKNIVPLTQLIQG